MPKIERESQRSNEFTHEDDGMMQFWVDSFRLDYFMLRRSEVENGALLNTYHDVSRAFGRAMITHSLDATFDQQQLSSRGVAHKKIHTAYKKYSLNDINGC